MRAVAVVCGKKSLTALPISTRLKSLNMMYSMEDGMNRRQIGTINILTSAVIGIMPDSAFFLPVDHMT
jgi:hypothetical protein